MYFSTNSDLSFRHPSPTLSTPISNLKSQPMTSRCEFRPPHNLFTFYFKAILDIFAQSVSDSLRQEIPDDRKRLKIRLSRRFTPSSVTSMPLSPRGPSFKKGCRISSRLREKVLSPFEETSLRKKRAKITVFLSLTVCGNWSKDLFLPIIIHIAVFPIVSKVRYSGNCPDSHRLNPEVHKNHNPFHTPCLSFE